MQSATKKMAEMAEVMT